MALRPFDIPPLDTAAEAAARARQDRLTKPPGSLGALEEIACRMAAIQGRSRPVVRKKWTIIAAADHGVTAEGVSPYPPDVTAQMVANFLSGGAAINVLAEAAGAEIVIVDCGVRADTPGDATHLRRLGRLHGSANMALGPAMPRAEAERLIGAGADVSHELARKGADIIVTGDMGIGNTTAAAALTAVFTGRRPTEVTGRGTGLDDIGLRRKVQVIERALAVNRPDAADPVGALAGVGGLEIAFLAGVILGAAERRTAVALDGFISGAAALVAQAIARRVTDYCFACHLSAEPGHRVALETLRLKPLLDLQMRLGEGTGAALGVQVVEAAVRLHNEMATFEEAGVSARESEETARASPAPAGPASPVPTSGGYSSPNGRGVTPKPPSPATASRGHPSPKGRGQREARR